MARIRGGATTLLFLCGLGLLLAACGRSSSPLDDAQTRPSVASTPTPGATAAVTAAQAMPPAAPAVPPTAMPQPAAAAADVPALPPLGADDPRRAAMLAYLQRLADSGQFMGSVLVADGDVLLVNEGFGVADLAAGRPNTPATQHRIGSLSKAFTAVAILRLAEQGLLALDDPVAGYLPDYPQGDAITIEHLLTHSAGIPNYESRPDLPQVVQTPIPLDDLIATFSSQPLLFAPGQGFAYSSSGYVLLSKIIEVVSGRSYADFIRAELLEPAGMARSGYDFLDPALPEPAVGYRLLPGGAQPAVETDSSWPSGAGALYSTVEDLYRWDRALAGDALLGSAARESLFVPRVSMPGAGPGTAYGYGWEIGSTAGQSSAAHGGGIFGFASFMARFAPDDAAIIVLSNGTQIPPRRIAEDLAALLFAAEP